MELIYMNDYGASYKAEHHPNPNCNIQLVIGTIGIYMSEQEVNELLRLVHQSQTSCNCGASQQTRCNKIWTSTMLIDACIKLGDGVVEQLEDLILGTKFNLNMDKALRAHQIN